MNTSSLIKLEKMSSGSVSQGWRNKGNYSYGNYQQSNDDGRRRSYLESALKSYYRAYETADDSEDKSSAAKNYGMAAWRLATVLTCLKEKSALVEFRFREAVKYFSKVCRRLLLNTIFNGFGLQCTEESCINNLQAMVPQPVCDCKLVLICIALLALIS